MICPKCGQPVQDDAKFCQFCGYNFAEQNNVNSQLNADQSKTSYFNSQSVSQDANPTPYAKYSFKWALYTCLKQKYACFQGRASRSEYWYFCLFSLSISIVLGPLLAFIIISVLGDNLIANILALGMLFICCFGLICPGLAVTVRRMHDKGHSGWFVLLFILIQLVPILNFIIGIAMIIYFATRGTIGPNQYGADPLQNS